MNKRSLFAYIKAIALACLAAAALTYLSLLIPGQVIAVCGNLGTPSHCPVLAYGFPFPFLADSQGISPMGSVARDPLSLLIGEDDLLWPQLQLSTAFWLLIWVAGVGSKRLWMGRRKNPS